MKKNAYNGLEHDWEEAVAFLVDGRREIIRVLLRLQRDAWRIKYVRGKWTVAQIVEHMNKHDAICMSIFNLANRCGFLTPPMKNGSRSQLSDPYSNRSISTPIYIAKPKGTARRASMIAELDKFARTIEHRITSLSSTKLNRVRLYSPAIGFSGITDWVMAIHYHDMHHFAMIQSAIEQLRAKGVNVDTATGIAE